MFSLWPPLMSDMQISDIATLEAEAEAMSININIQKKKNRDESQNKRQTGKDRPETKPDRRSCPKGKDQRKSRVYRRFNRRTPTVFHLPQPQPDCCSRS